MRIERKISVVICVVLVVITLFGGCIEITTEKKSLSIIDFHYCSAIRGVGDYDTHTKTYTVGEQIFMYFELEGFKKRDDESAQVYQTLTVTAPNGTALVVDGITLDNYVMIDQSLDATGMNVIWFDNHLSPVNISWPKGTYDVTIVVEDHVANKEVTYTTDFIIT